MQSKITMIYFTQCVCVCVCVCVFVCVCVCVYHNCSDYLPVQYLLVALIEAHRIFCEIRM